MNWAFGYSLNIRTVAIGAAIVAVALSAFLMRPLALALPSFSFGAAAAQPNAISLSHADAVAASSLVSSIDDVHTQADLVAYADSVMRSDPRITSIDIGEHSISMTYATTHSVLHVKTVSEATQATVAEDGSVTISGSWYRPLFAHIAQASSPSAGFSDLVIPGNTSQLSPATQARIITRLQGRFTIGAIQ